MGSTGLTGFDGIETVRTLQRIAAYGTGSDWAYINADSNEYDIVAEAEAITAEAAALVAA